MLKGPGQYLVLAREPYCLLGMGTERNYASNTELKSLTEALGSNLSQAMVSSETKSKILAGFYSELS